MAKLEVDGLDDMMISLQELALAPDAVLDEMLLAEAEIVKEEQKRTGEAMGVHRTGVTLESIKCGKVKKTTDGRAVYVTPTGKNKDGNRNAEVAFVNEYGTKRQKARPFIRLANEKAADKSIDAAEKIYDKYLKSKNL